LRWLTLATRDMAYETKIEMGIWDLEACPLDEHPKFFETVKAAHFAGAQPVLPQQSQDAQSAHDYTPTGHRTRASEPWA